MSHYFNLPVHTSQFSRFGNKRLALMVWRDLLQDGPVLAERMQDEFNQWLWRLTHLGKRSRSNLNMVRAAWKKQTKRKLPKMKWTRYIRGRK